MAYFTKKNAKIFYEIYGDGEETITLINGYTRPSSDFKLLGSFLAAQRRRVLIFDNRGSGRTETSLEFSIHDIVRDVIDMWDAFQIDKSHVLGISMGSYIAQKLALEAGQRIRSLCLVSSSSRTTAFPARFVWPKEPGEILARLSVYFHPEFVRKNTLLIEAMAKQIAKENKDNAFEQRARAQREALANAEDHEKRLNQLSLPCLILHGRGDKVIPVQEAYHLQSLIPGSRVHIYEGAGHMLMVEQKQDFYQRLSEFFKETSPLQESP